MQRELGLDRVVKLASNEGQFGPFPSALEALERGVAGLNRYPDGGAYRLRQALAEKHALDPSSVALAAGADAVIMYLSLAVLDPEDEIVCGWPSFPSYVLDAIKMGAEAGAFRSRASLRPGGSCWPRSRRARRSSTSATRTIRPER